MARNYNLKIISGGQTGVDRAALDTALELGMEAGGFCIKGRKAEDGRLPLIYQLTELPSASHLVRAERNVVEGDGTLILVFRRPTIGSTEQTRKFTVKHSKPGWIVELEKADGDAVSRVQTWLEEKKFRILNVAGPRESAFPGIYEESRRFLLKVFEG
ncbi:MAG: putative molybdenum carrier protein [Syntrophobacteraceae bacterium]